MTNIFFQFVDSLSNPLSGSKVSLKPFNGPFISGSVFAYTGPVSIYSDNTGTATFNGVIAGIYKVSFSNAGAVNIGNGVYQNFENTVFYINVLETGGITVNGMSYYITNYTNTGNSSSFAYTIQAANSLFAFNTASGVSTVTNALTASYVAGGGGSATSINIPSSSNYNAFQIYDYGWNRTVSVLMISGTFSVV